ncbi:hypothetical protein [Clostridium sp. C8-1-8]|uniref:hypothetical protein n=1 Tax=Clostridium sp. C8-1-8 TaxID=2698831 RepID=UPI00136A07EF|nr:hypothetical protein [Clostridium sp. C8-1-8]
MGKQINFYMDNDNEINFIRFCFDEGFKLLYVDLDDERVIEFDNLDDLTCYKKDLCTLYIYRNDFGNLVFDINDKHRIDITDSPVIEFNSTIIDDSKKQITSGRLWFENIYYEGNEQIKKSDILSKSYTLLCKWIKKNIPKREIQIKGYTYKEYISNKLMEKVYQEYTPV